MRAMIWSALAALAVGVNVSWAQDSGTAVSASGAPPQAGSAAAAGEGTGTEKSPGETWRYRKHQGMWWYWLPSNQWVYWTDDHWVPYEADSYAKLNASRRQQSYSTPSGNSSQGNWGPVRYNQWGQRQYPSSQRSSGLQQLGPVPAPGGVRSLPGWGGER